MAICWEMGRWAYEVMPWMQSVVVLFWLYAVPWDAKM